MARRSVSIEEQARDDISAEIERMIDALLASEGPAVDAESMSDAQQISQWGQRDPKIADPEGLKQQLMTTGLGQTPEILNELAVVKAHPEIAEMYAEPCDDALADMLTRLAEFPLRIGILEPYQDDPEEMVALAERLDRMWQREMMKQMAATMTPVNGARPHDEAFKAPAPAPPMKNGGAY